ncbi:hypothetical protein B0A49_04231 [Cryomyces minteri]|uniref:Uncharacterized protein n=1 Tax=Cryomyces minteri TaxID=331657 RepID=A0A4U0X9S5_9PEZI|nr:hypothetical protein B0A49_04231 [Cryomyces minteri]
MLRSRLTLIARWRKPKTWENHPSMKIQFCRRPDITTADLVLYVHHSWPDSKVMLVRTDGSVEFRYRDTMDVITADYNDIDPGPALAALALQHATSCYYQQDNDDVLAALPPYLPLILRFKFLHALYNFARISVDYVSVENQKQAPRILSNTFMVRVMSAQNTLGFTNDRKHQDPSGKIAWMILNLRSVVLNLRFAVPPREPSPPDIVRSLLRVVKWTLDLMCYVFRIVLDLWQHQRHADDKLLWRKKVSEWNTPGLVIIFSSIPRCLFRFILPYLITLFKQSQEAQSPSCSFIKTVKQRQIWKTLLAQFDSMPFQLAHFQTLLNEVDTAVRSAYAAGGILAEPQRHAVEKAMLIDGTIPTVLAPAVQRLLQPDVFLDALVQDPSFSALDILFYDTAWLGLHDEPSHTKKRAFDVLKKTPLPEGTTVRRSNTGGAAEDPKLDRGESENVHLWEPLGAGEMGGAEGKVVWLACADVGTTDQVQSGWHERVYAVAIRGPDGSEYGEEWTECVKVLSIVQVS